MNVRKRKKSFNIVYIRAAIEAQTGIRLSLKQTVAYLYQEGMITKSEAKTAIFPGYSALYGTSIDKNVIADDSKLFDKSMIPVDKVTDDWPGLVSLPTDDKD